MYELQIAVYKMPSCELIPLKKIILEKVKGQHLDLHGIWWFFTIFTRVCHLSLSSARFIRSLYSHPPSYASFFHVLSFLQGFPPQLLGVEYKSCGSALCEFLQPLGTPFYGRISCSVPCPWKPSALALPLVWQTKFYNLVKRHFKICYYVTMGIWKILNGMVADIN